MDVGNKPHFLSVQVHVPDVSWLLQSVEHQCPHIQELGEGDQLYSLMVRADKMLGTDCF